MTARVETYDPRTDVRQASATKTNGGTVRLKAISARDFLALNIPPRKMLLEPIFPAQGLLMLHGARGRGKTHLALGMAVAAANGRDFLRWKATEPHKVLFIDGELPQCVLQSWLAEAVAAAGGAEVGENLTLITPDLQECGIPDLATLGGQASLLEHVEPAELIILDNLSALVRSGKENEAESWLPIQEWALWLRRQGKSLMFLHHSGRSGEPRRTSKREDLLDTVIALRSPHNYKESDGLRAEVHFTKHRHFFGKDTGPFEVQLSTDQSRLPVWSTSNLEVSASEQAAKLFADGCDVRAVIEELHISRAAAFRYQKQYRQSQQSQARETG